ncbi:type VII secretion protein EccB [Amycolatopsis keratiniphila]|uniref:Type VII secretion protein EccB n=1 Tax=Amycolatopsis keratiniphila subsp. keratiniphila TaxID=227715 RepID=A0A1W2LP61_9PSEU|nr:type VII secretion protein EccB [Amycolatopsis keratiniphila]OLZ55987.1 type VII secretion protein EccB [Amycolatopsis keratiniphila subsp. nogabecina]ONF65301.1 type VII secretion protein EccB [Amycolatopsis keratiniphila subsp. keratiniphila]
MPSTPTTKSQVQAYQFVLRRMQSALVRRDAVMLHDPMRTHTRATIVGVVLAALGVLVFIIWGLLSPKPAVPDAGNIVIGEQSGTVYVVAGNPKKLIPTFNLASARLLIIAQSKQGQQQAGGKPTGPTQASEVKNPTVVSDEQLKNIPRGQLMGIPNGPQLMPTDTQRVSPEWGVCDEVVYDESVPQPDLSKTETTVYAGVKQLGNRELGQNEALLAKGVNGREYLIYRQTPDPNARNANAVKAEIKPEANAVRSALKLSDRPRGISQGLLDAIPEVPELKLPEVPGKGEKPNYEIDDMKVGDVFSTEQAEGRKDFYLITKDGIQAISPAVADIVQTGKNDGSTSVMSVPLGKIRNLTRVSQVVELDAYPKTVPTVLDATQGSRVSCLSWSITGEGGGRDGHTAVFVDDKLPKGRNADGSAPGVKIGTPGPVGAPINSFYMEPGFAAVVQSATGKETFDKGPIQLISDRGIRYGVPDAVTADSIGLNKRVPAPEAIVRILPTGASLNTQDVLRTFDTVPIDDRAGSVATQSQQTPAGN